MLLIDVPSNGRSGVNFTSFTQTDLPRPTSGYDSEINNDLILKFEDEQEAIDYIDVLRDFATQNNLSVPLSDIISDLIDSVSTNSFVQSYLGNR